MKLARQVARLLLPFHLRNQIRAFIFRDLRELGLLDYLRKLGFLTCKNYIQVNESNVYLNFSKDYVKAGGLLEEDKINPAVYLDGQGLATMHPFVAKTETILLEICDEYFSFRNNHLLNKELNVIGGEARTGKPSTSELDKQRPIPIYGQVLSKTIKIKGTVAYLSDPDPQNYYHWMCRALPLLRSYKKFYDFSEIDFFYLGQFPLASFHEECLKQAGIPTNKVIQEGCTAERLLMAIHNRSSHFLDPISDPINKESYLFSRNLFYETLKSLEARGKDKRLYINRGNAKKRRILNESQVFSLLESYGFESVVMDNKTVQEQASLVYQAEAIVALHGAALTNLLFVQPGVKVIELIPYGYVNNCFYVMASHAEADYFCLQGENLDQDKTDSRSIDTYIDIQKLEKILTMASLR